MAWLGESAPAGATWHISSLPPARQCPHSLWSSARAHKLLYEHEWGRRVTGKEGQRWFRHLPVALSAVRPLESALVAAGRGEDGLVCVHTNLLRKVSFWVGAGPGHPGQACSLEALRAPLAKGAACPRAPLSQPDTSCPSLPTHQSLPSFP